MSKKHETRSDRPFDELSLDSLDVVLGGSAGAPMGLGGSLAASHPSAVSPLAAGSPSALPGHFGLNLGSAAPHATAALPGAASPSPMGLGGNMSGMVPTHEPASAPPATDNGTYSNANPSGQAVDHTTDGHATNGHATNGHAGEALGVGASSAFQLLDEAAQDAAPHAGTPQGLGGNG